MRKCVLITQFGIHNNKTLLVDLNDFDELFEIYRNEKSPKIYKEHHVRLTDKGKEYDEDYFYNYQLLEARCKWDYGKFDESVEITGHYMWEQK